MFEHKSYFSLSCESVVRKSLFSSPSSVGLLFRCHFFYLLLCVTSMGLNLPLKFIKSDALEAKRFSIYSLSGREKRLEFLLPWYDIIFLLPAQNNLPLLNLDSFYPFLWKGSSVWHAPPKDFREVPIHRAPSCTFNNNNRFAQSMSHKKQFSSF